MSGYLELADGGFLGVRDGLVLGRVSACDVVVNDSKASRRHARLIVEGGVVEIEDLNSSNGTLLNGKPVDRRMMRDGDEVRIGKTVIVYREGDLPGAKSTSRSTRGSAAVFDDDDDLFGDAPSSASTISEQPRPSPPAPELIVPKPKTPEAKTPEVRAPEARAPEPKAAKPTPPKPPAAKPAPPAAKPAPPAPSSPSDDLLGNDLFGDDLSGDDAAPASNPPPPKPAPGNVVEFEDEVVEVQKAPARREPEPVRRPAEPVIEVRKPQPAAAPRAGAKPAAGADDVVGTSGRVLQYSKKAAGKNPLGDDLAQMSGGMRLLVAVVVLAIGAGIVYGVMTVMQ
tara:strand:+ start:118482 stop:119501 length:1020 start_codon:yes stop_codon:yes gene_type:complete